MARATISAGVVHDVPEDLGQSLADAVAFLAGPQGSWINAQVLRANGGFA
ncbi:hypothetical protein RSO41_06660 [Halomonas sp. I1]|nr:hypothetical protein [Halomonas sp. I1]MDT8894334.1 hypothetical protein [Halomonas sp. I1]